MPISRMSLNKYDFFILYLLNSSNNIKIHCRLPTGWIQESYGFASYFIPAVMSLGEVWLKRDA